MKKLLIYATTLTLTATVLISADYTNARADDGKSPHIDNNVQSPPTRWRIVRHTFRLHLPQNSKALSQLIIDVPSGLAVKNDISVTVQSGRKINANASVNGSKVLVAFPEPIAPGTRLNIVLNKVKRSGIFKIRLYRLSAKLVGIDADIPIGVARFSAR